MVHTEWNDELVKALAAPIPESEIKTKQQGGTNIRFTSDKYIMRVFDEHVGPNGWQDDYIITALAKPVEYQKKSTLGQVVCRLTVLGVTKSGAADMDVEERMYGSPATNAQAKAFKRAAMKFGPGKELWDKDAPRDDEDERPSYRSQSSNRSSSNTRSDSARSEKHVSNGASGGASPAQINYLTGDAFGVPMAVAEKLSGGKGGTASDLITMLKDAKAEVGRDEYEDNPTPHIRRALNKIDSSGKLAALLSSGGSNRSNDEDEDEDED